MHISIECNRIVNRPDTRKCTLPRQNFLSLPPRYLPVRLRLFTKLGSNRLTCATCPPRLMRPEGNARQPLK